MNRLSRAFVLMLVIFLAVSGAAMAAGSGYFGFGTTATYSGIFNPKLKRVIVAEIKQDSPAEKAGLGKGDAILEANGILIDGAPAKSMFGTFSNVSSGQKVTLKIKRVDGSLAEITLVAAPRPH